MIDLPERVTFAQLLLVVPLYDLTFRVVVTALLGAAWLWWGGR